jgi:hypothetical protein
VLGRGLAIALVVVATACASGPERAAGALCGGGPCAPPPRKPGHSLTSSVLCSCRACEPHGCCEEKDTRDEDRGCPLDSYDFAANDSCALGVSSCESRCFVHRWRVPVAQGCQVDRPASCCY